MVRSILAVLAGFFTMVIAVTAVTLVTVEIFAADVVHKEFWQPTTEFLLVNLLVITLFGIIAGYLTAALASRSRQQHALILAAASFLPGLWMLATNDSRSPVWYLIVLLLVGPLCAWLGGALRSARGVAVLGHGT